MTTVIELIQQCRRYTGLTLNLQKTVVFTTQQEVPKKAQGILVMHDLVKYLGTYLGISTQPEERNFEHILRNFKAVASKWQSHALTLPAQIVVMRSLILSVATHILSMVYITPEHLSVLQKFSNDFLWREHNHLQEKLMQVYITPEHLSVLQKLSNDFLWRGHNHLQEKLMQNTMKWGGLKHIHVKHIMHKIRVKWMIHLWEDQGKTWSLWIWPMIQYLTRHDILCQTPP